MFQKTKKCLKMTTNGKHAITTGQRICIFINPGTSFIFLQAVITLVVFVVVWLEKKWGLMYSPTSSPSVHHAGFPGSDEGNYWQMLIMVLFSSVCIKLRHHRHRHDQKQQHKYFVTFNVFVAFFVRYHYHFLFRGVWIYGVYWFPISYTFPQMRGQRSRHYYSTDVRFLIYLWRCTGEQLN